MSYRVLMFGWEFPPHNSGGLGVACKGIATALAQKNVDILFVLPKKVDLADDTLRFLFANVGKVDVKGIDTSLTPYVSAKEYELYRKYLSSDIYGADLFAEVARYAASVSSIIENEHFDLIHAHDWLSFLAGVEAKRLSGKPLILHVHITGFEQAGGGYADSRVYEIEKMAMRKADAIIAVSERTKQIIIEKYGIAADKVYAVHNGIEVNEYPPLEEKNRSQLPIKKKGWKMVLFVGRLTLHKGPDYFLRAAKRVLERYPSVIFVIAGSGDMEWQLMREAADLGIADKVFFAGFTRGDELIDLYKNADLYVLPSVSEPFGITPLESAINGTPVLISKQSGVSEVLSHALRVDFWDTEEMANKIIATLYYKPLWKQLRDYARGEVLQLSWARTAEKIMDIYRIVCKKCSRVLSKI